MNCKYYVIIYVNKISSKIDFNGLHCLQKNNLKNNNGIFQHVRYAII